MLLEISKSWPQKAVCKADNDTLSPCQVIVYYYQFIYILMIMQTQNLALSIFAMPTIEAYLNNNYHVLGIVDLGRFVASSSSLLLSLEQQTHLIPDLEQRGRQLNLDHDH